PRMDTLDLDRLLKDTLDDHRVRAGEKKVLADWVAAHAPDEAALARSRAFALAKSESTGEAAHVLEWLEDVVRLFCRPPSGPAPAPPEPAGAYFSPGTTCIQEVLRQFHLARRSCDVCVFTITDDRITDAILRAHGRGVKVRVIADDEKSHD